MEITPKYLKPLMYSNAPVTTLSYWDEAVAAFDMQEYKESLTAIINYINQDILKGKEISSNMKEILYPHGTTTVSISVKEDVLYISSSFLRVPEKHKIPLLRKVAELNFTPLTLAQIRYSKDKNILAFYYNTPLSAAQPNKIYDLIREICVFADDFDDEFIKKYDASFYQKPIVESFSEKQEEQAWEHFTQYLDEALTYIDYFETKRWDKHIWDIILDALFCISDQVYVNGVLKTSIQDTIWTLQNDESTELHRKNTIGKAFLQKLAKIPPEEILNDIFLAKKLLSTKYRTSPKILEEYFQNEQADILCKIESQDFVQAFFALKYAFLNLMYNFNLDSKQWEVITDSLTESSQVSWKEGTMILKETFDLFLSGKANTPPVKKTTKSKKGFFAKLFS